MFALLYLFNSSINPLNWLIFGFGVRNFPFIKLIINFKFFIEKIHQIIELFLISSIIRPPKFFCKYSTKGLFFFVK